MLSIVLKFRPRTGTDFRTNSDPGEASAKLNKAALHVLPNVDHVYQISAPDRN